MFLFCAQVSAMIAKLGIAAQNINFVILLAKGV
jgi:hypothetical protein